MEFKRSIEKDVIMTYKWTKGQRFLKRFRFHFIFANIEMK